MVFSAADAKRMPDPNSEPRYDARTVLLPQVEKLRAGDIILTSNVETSSRKASKQSGVIRTASGGRFSHALICSQPPTLIEAISTGVSTLSLLRCFAHARENVRVLRHPDASIAQRAAELAQLEIGRDYSIARAVQSIFPARTLARVSDHGIFCSALVAQAFTLAGDDEFARTPIDKTTPATIDRMTGMIDVTDEVFRHALAPNNAEAMTALDGDAAPTLSSQQTEISSRYAKALLPAADRLLQEHPQLGSEVTPTLYGLLDLILRALDAVPACDPPSRTAFIRAVGDLDGRLADLLGSGELLQLMQEIGRADNETYQRALHESFSAHPDIDVGAMRGFLQTTRSQLAARRAAHNNMAKWERGRSRAAQEYLAVEGVVIENLAAREPLLEEILQRIS